jgi:hypothetical protein
MDISGDIGNRDPDNPAAWIGRIGIRLGIDGIIMVTRIMIITAMIIMSMAKNAAPIAAMIMVA